MYQFHGSYGPCFIGFHEKVVRDFQRYVHALEPALLSFDSENNEQTITLLAKQKSFTYLAIGQPLNFWGLHI